MFHLPQKTTNYPISLYVPLLRWLWFTLFASLCNTDLIVFHVHISFIFVCSSFSFGPTFFMSWLYSGLMMHK